MPSEFSWDYLLQEHELAYGAKLKKVYLIGESLPRDEEGFLPDNETGYLAAAWLQLEWEPDGETFNQLLLVNQWGEIDGSETATQYSGLVLDRAGEKISDVWELNRLFHFDGKFDDLPEYVAELVKNGPSEDRYVAEGKLDRLHGVGG